MRRRSWLRQRLGSAKWHVTEVWPADLRQVRARQLRNDLLARGLLLPPLPSVEPQMDLEVHMLCGEATADMGIWASWSILRFLRGATLYVHSDGTLTDGTVAAWKGVVPQLQLIDADASERRVNAELAGTCPNLLSWRSRSLMARQNIDYFLFGTSSYVLGMDSDVLCFQNPAALIDAIQLQTRSALWMHDCVYAYSMPEQSFQRRYGNGVARVNGGFWLAPRFTLEDFRAMDGELAAWECQWRDHFWSPQTLLAAAFRNVGGKPLDPESYYLGRGAHRASFVVRHYPSPKFHRPRFFTEGIPVLAHTAHVDSGYGGS